MEFSKPAEEGAIQSSGVRDSRVAEHHGVGRCKCRDLDHDRHQAGRPVSMDSLHVDGADCIECLRIGVNHLPPGNYPGKTHGNEKVDGHHDKNRNDYARGNDTLWLLHFVSEITNLVIAEEVEHHQHGAVAQAEQERDSDMPRPGRKIQEYTGSEMSKPSADDP